MGVMKQNNNIYQLVETSVDGAMYATTQVVNAEASSSLKIQCNMVDGFVEAYQQSGSDVCCIKAVSHGFEPLKRMIGDIPNSVVDLLLKAVNNRTIERNYFRLYGELADGTITEEEFNREIEENESEYVLVGDEEPNEQTLRMALILSQRIKDVKDTEDLSSLFSINSAKLDSYINKISANGNLRKCK